MIQQTVLLMPTTVLTCDDYGMQYMKISDNPVEQ